MGCGTDRWREQAGIYNWSSRKEDRASSFSISLSPSQGDRVFVLREKNFLDLCSDSQLPKARFTVRTMQRSKCCSSTVEEHRISRIMQAVHGPTIGNGQNWDPKSGLQICSPQFAVDFINDEKAEGQPRGRRAPNSGVMKLGTHSEKMHERKRCLCHS